MPKIKFGIWDTPFSKGDLQIIDLHWGGGVDSINFENGMEITEKAHPLFENIDLQIQAFENTTRSIYKVKCLRDVAISLCNHI